MNLQEAFAGVLIGTAVGDALGLPAEGMSRQRIQRRWPGPWRHRFLFGGGMISDDTEHTLFVAQALLAHPNDPIAFQRSLAWKLQLWFLGLPAGIGFATLRAILKLWLGFPATRSGVYSAGNGPAMRSAIIGAYFADNPTKRRQFVSAATRITHVDPKAEIAALAIAEMVAWTLQGSESIQGWLPILQGLGTTEEWTSICRRLADAVSANISVQDFADSLGLDIGVSGYAFHSVPVALYAFLRHRRNFRAAMESVLNCGGDTDTVGAMVGAMTGADVGRTSIPSDWVAGVRDWPRSTSVLEQLAKHLADEKLSDHVAPKVGYFWPGLLVRNALFLTVVLLHGFRRLLPPY